MMIYSLSLKEIPRAKQKGSPEGSGYIFFVYPDLNHNTDMLNYSSCITLPGISIVGELILCIALSTGQYGKILPR